ncbi:hypothetical protein TCAL_17161 [Tigriopus californicus]|uniref:SAM domain-containing protein n=1 Tax=Tigriopus californicus TaxID=6832 RepID=A0A553P2P5_TIGCA|nr:hypothetical protein TCAL_17161 [Tigriopus californicus]
MDKNSQPDLCSDQYPAIDHSIRNLDRGTRTGFSSTMPSHSLSTMIDDSRMCPQVTVSSVGGAITHYHSFTEGNFAIEEEDLGSRSSINNRIWRSHSLTPTVGSHLSTPDREWSVGGGKVRSNSLTVVRYNNNKSGSTVMMSGGTTLSTTPSETEKQIEELLNKLPDGSGMKELHIWLKSLRLHKYTTFLLKFSYEDLMALNAEQLPKDRVTEGAKGKILKEVKLINERPSTIRKLQLALEDISKLDDLVRLEKLLPEVEKVVLMPLKPYNATHHSLSMDLSSHSNNTLVHVIAPPKAASDSGMSDSFGDIPEDSTMPNWPSSCKPDTENIPQSIFEVLKKVCSIIVLSDCPVPKVVTKVVKNASALLEHCIEREAYQPQQKQTWWVQTTAGECPVGSQWLHEVVPKPSGLGLSQFGLFPEGHDGLFMNLQRRSVPEITPPLLYPQAKRNSYQGDARTVPITDSEILSNLLDCRRRESTLSCDSGYYLSLPESRRNSSLSSSDGSRRNSSLSSSDESRRNSFLDDSHHRDSFFSSTPTSYGRDHSLSSNISMGGTGCPLGLQSSPSDRRDSGLPQEPRSFLSVGSAAHARGAPGLTPLSGGLSSGFISDGSTDSQEEIHNLHKLNQDLYNISLSVTKQALEEN